MKKIEHQSLSDQAYHAIRDGMQEGLFIPMEPLVIRTLAANYGISATPIREALQRLVAERLLTVLPNRSIVVPRMTQRRFRELMPIRAALEGMAAELAVDKFTEEEIAQLSELTARVEEVAKRHDSAGYLALNREFHFTVYRRANNPELLLLINDLWLKVGPVFTGLFDDEHFKHHANDEHRNILAAIERRDAEAAGKFMRQDIDIAAKALLPLMPLNDSA
ncbi:GntR family transcriptional regulator [Thioclava sp.]|uniref:GntR family transcriptional regulator n=1 Tax=Thioclava sp. TaxID=1933450 RepID=UPI003242FF6E